MESPLRPRPLAPLLVAGIEGMPLRLFASPLTLRDGTPDLPWHSADDLRAILRLPEAMRAVFQRKMRADLGGEIETVATPGGVTTIAPMYMGEGMLGFVRHRRAILPTDARKRVQAGFRRAHTAAMPLMLPHLGPLERLAFYLEALERRG